MMHQERSLRYTGEHTVGEEALLLEVGHLVGHEVVEGVVATLERLLVGQPRLLKQVDHHVGSGQLSGGVEVDPDKLTEPKGDLILKFMRQNHI